VCSIFYLFPPPGKALKGGVVDVLSFSRYHLLKNLFFPWVRRRRGSEVSFFFPFFFSPPFVLFSPDGGVDGLLKGGDGGGA